MNVLLKVAVVCLVTTAGVYMVEACNEAICAPLVSKCMLIKCCDCEMNNLKNCTCCRDCQICLSKLYTECCSCVGLCPPPDPDDMTKSSTVEELSDPIHDLFNVLTEEEDPLQRWITFSYTIDLDKMLFQPGTKMTDMPIKIIGVGKDDTKDKVLKEESEHILGVRNCTAAFFSECMSIAKCKAACKSMGAAKYRWFHNNGCCQCVGMTCPDYGLNEPKCLKCPVEEDLMQNDMARPPLDDAAYSAL